MPQSRSVALIAAVAISLAMPGAAIAEGEGRGSPVEAGAPTTAPVTGFAPVNGLQMYYEIHGRGQPLVLLHGALVGIDLSFSQIGYSRGGVIGLELAARHPDLVRKLVVASAAFTPDRLYPEVNAGIGQLTTRWTPSRTP